MVFWTYHHVEEIEKNTRMKTAQNSDIRHYCMRHNTSRREAAHAHQHAPHVFFSQMDWPDPTRPTHTTQIMMTSSWHKHGVTGTPCLRSDGVFVWWSYSIEFCVVYNCFSSIVFIYITFNLISSLDRLFLIVYFTSMFYKYSSIKDRLDVII
jgi:hypothetical protein